MGKLAEREIKRIATTCPPTERKALSTVVGAMAIITLRLLDKRRGLAKMRCKALSVAGDYTGQSAFDFIYAVQKKRLVIGQSAQRYKKALRQAQKSYWASEHGGGGKVPCPEGAAAAEAAAAGAAAPVGATAPAPTPGTKAAAKANHTGQ
jgi:hypothetical protein